MGNGPPQNGAQRGLFREKKGGVRDFLQTVHLTLKNMAENGDI